MGLQKGRRVPVWRGAVLAWRVVIALGMRVNKVWSTEGGESIGGNGESTIAVRRG